jgi:hypothetical protein
VPSTHAAACATQSSASAGELAVLQQLLLAVAGTTAPSPPVCPLQAQLLQALSGLAAAQPAAAAAGAGPCAALLQLLQAAAAMQTSS